MRKKRLSTPGSAETLTEGAGASLKKLGGESGASPEKPSKPGGRRVSRFSQAPGHLLLG